MKGQVFVDIICLLFILLFTYAAITKLLDYEKFVVQLGQSSLLTVFADWIAWLIPAIEILTAIILMIPKSRLLGFYAAFTLMVMFTSYIIAILNFSDYIPCSCGGVLENLGWTAHLIFNIGFVLLALIAILLYPKPDSNTQHAIA